MTSTTNVKKEVIDFLWEWAENHGEWAKLLLESLLVTRSALSITERNNVFQYFLQGVKLQSGLTPLNISKPVYNPPSKSIKIISLSDITGVNKLALNQTINFSENLTVIYGENGTGKTGYGRVLKALGFSYETGGVIYSNVYKGKENQSAKIEYESNGSKKTFNWDGSNRNAELDSISVFNNHCVAISLADRQLVVTPIGFELFNLITDELNDLMLLLNLEKQKYAVPDLSPFFTIGTPQYKFINNLTINSSITDLNTLSTYSDEEEKKLKEKVSELQSLNKSLIESTIQNLKLQVSELDQIIAKIVKAQSILNVTTWQDLNKYNEEINQLQSQTQKGLKEIVGPFDIQFYESSEFRTFLTATESYIKLLAKTEYPQDNDVCIYCQQKLNTQAKDLIHNYRTLLNDTTQIKLNEIVAKKNHFKAQIAYIDSNIKFSQPTFGYDNENQLIQPAEISNYNKTIEALKKLTSEPKVTEQMFSIDYEKYLSVFNNKKHLLIEMLSSQQLILNDLSAKELALKNEINELKDRKKLLEKYSHVVKAIDYHKKTHILNSHLNSFNTRSISLKTSEARDELVKNNFNSIFKAELDALRKSHLDIDLNFATTRGTSQVLQKVRAHNLIDILSEGEQKAIALAEFLTELQLDNSSSPVVFDDPVNSLDHHLVDDFARRIIKLSQNRQVIIFTHSILLFNSLFYFRDKPSYKGITFAFNHTKNNHGETGFISNAEELNSVTSFIGRINVLINGAKNRPEGEMAKDGYGYLRAAIELCVENEIFNSTIKRYQKNVALTQFIKVNGQKLDIVKDQLNEIFERSSGYITGHSNPMEINNEPTLKELNKDFEDFKAIRNQFVK